jgi:hypothetical protein
VIFGLAGGTGTLALRLPEPELSNALAEPGHGASLSYPTGTLLAVDIGPDWGFLRPFHAANVERFTIARSHAAGLSAISSSRSRSSAPREGAGKMTNTNTPDG